MSNTIEVLAQLNRANLEPQKESVVYLMLKISGRAGESHDRPGLNLGMVVDRSGSMGCQKMDYTPEVKSMKLTPSRMTGYGALNLPPGSWSDDSSLPLCLAESLCEAGYDLDDLSRQFVRWYLDGRKLGRRYRHRRSGRRMAGRDMLPQIRHLQGMGGRFGEKRGYSIVCKTFCRCCSEI